MTGADDEQILIERLRAGDKTACAQCIERHSPAIYRLALRMVGSEAEAEDVTQETFLQAFRGIDNFEWRSSLATWLYRIAHNLVLMRLRKRQPFFVSIDLPVDGEEPETTPAALLDWCCLPDQEFAASETRTQLNEAIAALPASLREVFVLRELEGLSTEETAAALDITVANAKVRLHRARLWLRERLSGYFTELVQSRTEQ